MTNKETPNYSEFDPEVVSLCRAMNALPGVTIDDSCCGHGNGPFHIFFSVAENDHRGLFILTRSVDRRYFKYGNEWNITLSASDCPKSPLPICFTLESNARGEEAYTQAQAVVDNILYHRKHKNFLKGYGLQECSLREDS
jgi:hypothetical protein